MSFFRMSVIASAVAFCAQPEPSRAAELANCLSKEQQRLALATGKVVPLAQAKRLAAAHKGEVVRASLCYRHSNLVYLLTLLARDGKVSRVTVDAATGRLAGSAARR